MGFGLWGWLGSELEVGRNYDVDDDDLGGLGSVWVRVHRRLGGEGEGG